MTEPETYDVRLGCIACGIISRHTVPVETHWFDHFRDGVKCNNCQCSTPPDCVTMWGSNYVNKTGPFDPEDFTYIRQHAKRVLDEKTRHALVMEGNAIRLFSSILRGDGEMSELEPLSAAALAAWREVPTDADSA